MINAIVLSQTRTELGLSQRKLAILSGLNYQVIRRLELGGDDGNLTLRELGKICTALRVSPSVLLSQRESSTLFAPSGSPSEDLDVGQARILRAVQRGADLRRSLTVEERQTVVPLLMKRGLAQAATGGTLRLTAQALISMPHPEELLL